MKLRLQHGRTNVDLAPGRGGGILAFHHGGQPVFRDACGDDPTDLACVALLPFANRIASGRFRIDGQSVELPLLPGEAHALHGEGWLRAWQVDVAGDDHASLSLDHDAGDWPWRYRAVQTITLGNDGYCHEIALTNQSGVAMPGGLGLHPWFPRTAMTRFVGRHRGEWQTGADKLPADFVDAGDAVDWWRGLPVATRLVDRCYAGRAGELRIIWPEKRIALAMLPSSGLSFTQVYVPEGEDFFCVEPVSHMPDAVNRRGDTGIAWLQPGETIAASVQFQVSAA